MLLRIIFFARALRHSADGKYAGKQRRQKSSRLPHFARACDDACSVVVPSLFYLLGARACVVGTELYLRVSLTCSGGSVRRYLAGDGDR